ncbi:MAG: LLM class flavin-dependent oxidoreductase [Acidimicrobiales bacterium]|nr:LLM class flavin-dependent oxidoreductase [Acidimicrobiales bacterium]RZV45690.1 MAG: LLM class flavin-dependent oxidoreductase [Acidimicrobiales bacterium]
MTTPLSVLDLSVVPKGTTSTDALLATTRLAQRADKLGFTRFWVAEHHNMDAVASTEPAVLIAHLAASTDRINVGSGGVMLPNHAPLVVAEQFAMLEALHPGRIDLGIGRAPGTDHFTARALRRNTDGSEDEDFPQHVLEVMALLGDARMEGGLAEHFRATPVATTSPTVALLGSSGFSAQLAGMLGLPFGFAHHFGMGGTSAACDTYREFFKPSPILDEPHLIVTAVALAAETKEEAQRLLAPHQVFKHGLRTGRMFGLFPTDEALAHPVYDEAVSAGTNAVWGTGADVAEGLLKLGAEHDATELMISIPATDPDERLASLERTAAAWWA